VTGHLLDTNVALLALTTPSSLKRESRRALEAGPNVLSAVAYWEVVLKAMKGFLEVDDLRSWWSDALEQLGATPLPLRPEHVAAGEIHHRSRSPALQITSSCYLDQDPSPSRRA
jgi:PIN domain nuclease of toxin-antitoxin system